MTRELVEEVAVLVEGEWQMLLLSDRVIPVVWAATAAITLALETSGCDGPEAGAGVCLDVLAIG